MRIATILAASVMLAACGGSEIKGEFETEDGEDASYSIDEDSGETTATIKTEEGTATFRSGENIEVDLPGGFTIFKGAKVLSNSVFEQNDAKGVLIVMESDASPKEMAEHYRKQAESAGVEIKLEMTLNDGQMLGGEGPDGATFTFNANREDGKTSAQLVVGDNFGK